jgi:small-conductance mechanosensitive channel
MLVLKFLLGWHAWLISAGILLVALLVSRVAHTVIFSAGKKLAARTGSLLDESIFRHSHLPARWILPILTLFFALPLTALPPSMKIPIRHTLGLGLIGCAAWLGIALIEVFEDVIAHRYRVDVQDNLRARKIQTQTQVLHRIAVVVVSIVAISVMLMTFPEIRQFGVSLFASAGLAGLVVAMAARPTLSSLIAGVQIALTEPIRIDDVVIVDGEWGRIEEIGTTYVVVRIWDLRRLIVPLSYFIEHPFQNWTRTSASILGSVFIYTDYTAPVEEIRQEFRRILELSPLWDKQVCSLQVTNTSERTVELRALLSAADSSAAWDLRCLVREKLIAYLQTHYPGCLPTVRIEMASRSAEGNPARATADSLKRTLK